MEATQIRLDKLMTISNQQYIAPIFQRKYSWKEEQCTKLWEDIINISNNPNQDAGHYIGSLVCHQPSMTMPGKVSELMIIDGQQRLTTMSLIMIAIARKYKEKGDESAYNMIMNNYIINQIFITGNNYSKYKLVPTYEDRDTYFAIVEGTENKMINPSRNLLNNFNLFCDYLNDNQNLLEKIYIGINKLDLVYVKLSQRDNPQLIFESMNSTGLGLSQGDLLRNYLLLGMDQLEQENLYTKYRRPMEQNFGQAGYTDNFDQFLRDYITIYKKTRPRIGEEYEEYKNYFADSGKTKEELLLDLEIYAKFFVKIALCKDEDQDLNTLWKEIKTQKIDVSYPFLMRIYADYDTDAPLLNKDDFIEIIKAINSYVYRRYIVGIPTNSLNKTFSVLYNSVEKSDYKNSILATLVLLDSYKEFPTDEEFKQHFAKKDIYNTRLKNYTLEKLENDNHLNKITIDGTDISIEHILPETPILKKHWQIVLGENWKELQKENVHRIGNLTITKGVYNSQMSDLPFLEKLQITGGIRYSKYRLSNNIVDKEKWDLEEINKRSEYLAEQALHIWQRPQLNESQLEPYLNKTLSQKGKNIYTNINHMASMNNSIQNIYNELDSFILGHDGVIKEITKLYIAYKYEGNNFIEIIPSQSSLKLIFDIPYTDIINPIEEIEDIETIGHWGTGSSRISLKNRDNIEYIKGLIKQSLEDCKKTDLE